MDFGIATSGEKSTRWLKAAMIACFATAAGVLAYAIQNAQADRSLTQTELSRAL
jgi:hypothetical protein